MLTTCFDLAVAYHNLEGETVAISSFVEIVIKLNESSFKPVFRRLYDWAFADETGTYPPVCSSCTSHIPTLCFLSLSIVKKDFVLSCVCGLARLFQGHARVLKRIRNITDVFNAGSDDTLHVILAAASSKHPQGNVPE